jgi:antitoxin ParD1/3/4
MFGKCLFVFLLLETYTFKTGDDFLKLVTVKLPERLIADMDQLVKAGIYHNRSDAIREAVRELLRRELWQPRQG